MSRTQRSGEAVAAQHRKAGFMKHRNQPRGGARNEFLDFMEEYEDSESGCYVSRGKQMIYYLTDEVGTILAIYKYDSAGLDLARTQGRLLAGSFPESEIYLHSGSFAAGNEPEVGYSSSMKGTTERIFSGRPSSQCATVCHTGCNSFR